MGDHGDRFHAIRSTAQGELEVKYPFFSMMVPRKLLKNNPSLKKNLEQNTESITKIIF